MRISLKVWGLIAAVAVAHCWSESGLTEQSTVNGAERDSSIAFNQSARTQKNDDADGKSSPTAKFGGDWPEVKDCLEYSEESGDWLGGTVTYRFQPDGTFRASYQMNYFNRLYRLRKREIVFTGKWKLAKREITIADQKALDIVVEDKERGYFLQIEFDEVTVTPPFYKSEEYSKIFPSEKGGRLSSDARLFLDEKNTYPVPGTQFVGKSDPRVLHWIVMQDELSFFPKNTGVGERAWTIIHHVVESSPTAENAPAQKQSPTNLK